MELELEKQLEALVREHGICNVTMAFRNAVAKVATPLSDVFATNEEELCYIAVGCIETMIDVLEEEKP